MKTAVDDGLAERVGVKYTGLTLMLTSFSEHGIGCREAMVDSITPEGRTAPLELVAVCSIPETVKELLRRQNVNEHTVMGVHTLKGWDTQ